MNTIHTWAACVLLLVVVALPTSSRADSAKDALKQLEAEFNAAAPGVRADHPLLLLNYVEHGGELFSYAITGRFARLARDDSKFRIRKLRRKKEHIELELEVSGSESARLKIYLYDRSKLSEVFQRTIARLMLNDLFEFGDPPYEHRFSGNAQSKQLHLATSNHLPEEADRIPFDSVLEGEAAGFRRCPACFSDSRPLPIPGYAQIRRAALERARYYSVIFPPVEDAAIQNHVAELGQRLLDAFPLDLNGYNYEFAVLRSEALQANSFPTGFVYLTDTIYDSAESEMELAAVIAHEIAHVEMDLLGAVDTSNAQSYKDALKLYEDRRAQEMAADWAAAWTLLKLYEPEAAFSGFQNILRKLAFANGELLSDEDAPWATHPAVGRRLKALDFNELALFDGKEAFCGFSESGDVVIELRPLALSFDEDKSYVIVAAVVSDFVNKPFQFIGRRVGRVTDSDGKELYLASEREVRLKPGQSNVLMLQLLSSNSVRRAGSSPDTELKAGAWRDFVLNKVPDVERWRSCQSQ